MTGLEPATSDVEVRYYIKLAILAIKHTLCGQMVQKNLSYTVSFSMFDGVLLCKPGNTDRRSNEPTGRESNPVQIRDGPNC